MPSFLQEAGLRQARRLNRRPCVGRLPPGRQRPYHILSGSGGAGLSVDGPAGTHPQISFSVRASAHAQADRSYRPASGRAADRRCRLLGVLGAKRSPRAYGEGRTQ